MRLVISVPIVISCGAVIALTSSSIALFGCVSFDSSSLSASSIPDLVIANPVTALSALVKPGSAENRKIHVTIWASG